jgi:hypothetical protein
MLIWKQQKNMTMNIPVMKPDGISNIEQGIQNIEGVRR